MYDPKFSVKQMYDQYGSSRTKKADPKPSKSSGFGGMGPDPAERFGGSPTRGLGSKPDYSSSAYDSGGLIVMLAVIDMLDTALVS